MSDILRRARLVNREIFDPKNESHLESLKVYLRTGSWGNIQFYPEAPYTEAPASVMSKFSRHILQVAVESNTERASRLAARGVVAVPPAETSAQAASRLANTNAVLATMLKVLFKKSE